MSIANITVMNLMMILGTAHAKHTVSLECSCAPASRVSAKRNLAQNHERRP